MMHEMYDAMNCVSLMFMIYECNGCACKLSSCLVEEDESWIMKSLTVAGENKSTTVAGELKSLIVEKTLGPTVGDRKSLATCGD